MFDKRASDIRDRASRELASVLENLPQGLLQPFVMVFVQKKPRNVIAATLGITVLELEKRLIEALMICRTRLAEPVDDTTLLALYPGEPLEIARQLRQTQSGIGSATTDLLPNA